MREPLFFSLRMGAFLGGSFFLLFVISQLIGLHPWGSVNMLAYPLLIAYVIYSIYYYKKYEMAGDLRFWQGLVVGIGMATVGIAAHAILIFLYIELVPNDIMEAHRAMLTAHAMENQSAMVEGMGQLGFDRFVADIKNLTVRTSIMDDAVKKMFVGDIIAIIAAVFFRR